MTITLEVVLYIIATILLVLAALNVGARIALGWAGLHRSVHLRCATSVLTAHISGNFSERKVPGRLPASVLTHLGNHSH